jgi:hypothetical protein
VNRSSFARQREKYVKTFLNIIAVLLVLAGAVWSLQGINILPGSIMTGQIKWAVYGGIAVMAGIALLVLANRHKDSSPEK